MYIPKYFQLGNEAEKITFMRRYPFARRLQNGRALWSNWGRAQPGLNVTSPHISRDFGMNEYLQQQTADFPFPPQLENDRAILLPLQEADFDALYTIASDWKVWEQHPQSDRWKEGIFRVFFDGAMRSKGAFKIVDKDTGMVAGSTRFYHGGADQQDILIGYTFYATRYWGTGLNPAVKKLMLDYAFQFVRIVHLHVGATNYRSQKAVEKLGARKIAETPDFVYEIRQEDHQC
ncbi:GNAT family N-acetyltransferase [Parapedobacter sp. DT-150]|uniref:GNAT family N-acetyltransferase n=1 Tax=Parapedobacter sp. DT-150 TaxID=3396162 RepID=UPI003F196260